MHDKEMPTFATREEFRAWLGENGPTSEGVWLRFGKAGGPATLTAAEALEMGLVNKVVPFDDLERECMDWAAEMMQFSPTALRFMKASFNAATDGLAGIQQLAGDATLLYYTTDEAKEGRDAFKEKRAPDFTQFPKFP